MIIAMDISSGGFMSNPMMKTAVPVGIIGNIHQRLDPLYSQCRALNPVDPNVPQFLYYSEESWDIYYRFFTLGSSIRGSEEYLQSG